jgi:hypothetical protein
MECWTSAYRWGGTELKLSVADLCWGSSGTWTFCAMSSSLTSDMGRSRLTLGGLRHCWLQMRLQVLGATRGEYRPWPAFLHLKRGRVVSPLVPVMVGDNPTSMGPRIPVVTRLARSERVAGE